MLIDLLKNTFLKNSENYITPILIIVFLLTAIINYNKAYTACTFLIQCFVFFGAKYTFEIKWLDKFYIIYSALLLLFLIVNDMLTGTGMISLLFGITSRSLWVLEFSLFHWKTSLWHSNDFNELIGLSLFPGKEGLIF